MKRKAKAATKPKSTSKKTAKTRAKSKSSAKAGASATSASRLIDKRIRELGGWRGETLARMRALIHEADPKITEEWKWSVPVWSHDGIVCTGESYAKAVKLTFAQGARVEDPSRLFNSSLQGNTRRAIDIHEGEQVNARAFKALVKAAVALNRSLSPAKNSPVKKRRTGEKVVLLSGGNPQIAKGEGDAPVQAYIAAMPDWKREIGERLDALIVRTVPNVRKAVKWNSPFYGVEGQGWFLSFHVFNRYVKVTFFSGASLRPVPPGASKHEAVRYCDIHEGELDEARMASWVKQAAALPGYLA